MAMVRSSFGALEDLHRRVTFVGSPDFKVAVARRLTGTVLKLLADEFRGSRDPYGRVWKPVRRRGKPLIDTGRLRASATGVRAEGAAVRVSIPVEYASYHQFGTRRIAQRQIVPMAETGGLGPIWAKAFEREIELAIHQAMGRPG